jgi:hypothetical protein
LVFSTKLISRQPLFDNYHEFKPQWKRVKFSIFRRGYDEALTKIRENNTLLERLMNQDKELFPDGKRKKRSDPVFNEIRGHAASLYRGLARSWTCNCTVAHCTNLRLDARLPGLWATDQGSFTEASEETLVGFKVNFLFETEIRSGKNLPWLWQEGEIRVVSHERSIRRLGILPPLEDANTNSIDCQPQGRLLPAERPSKMTSKLKKAVKFTKTPCLPDVATASSVPERGLPMQISNLCLMMWETSMALSSTERCLGYLIQENRHLLELYLTCQGQTARYESNKSLADLLSERNHDGASFIGAAGNLPLARGERLGLALTVASSVLQLYDTPWLRQRWGKEDIVLDMTREKEIFERAFISTRFPPAACDALEGNHSYPVRNLTLFCLGIVLIEITLGRTLESMRTDDDPLNVNGESDILTKLCIARRALEMGIISGEAGIRYGEAVYRCIWSEFGVLNTSLGNDDFRRAVYDGVIVPLEEDMKFFNGLLS